MRLHTQIEVRGRITVVLGGQAGSEGKGKFAGYLAKTDETIVASVCNFMPNAGHTWVSDDGEKVMVQQLPQAVINPNIVLFISAGASIDPDIFLNEVNKYDAHDRVYIHPRAMVILEKHRQMEAQTLNRISSTLKGCGASIAEKVMRGQDVILARDHEALKPYVREDFTRALHELLLSGHHILVEAPQGYDLDINHGLEYPYCTSRQTTTAQVIADAGLPPQAVEDVIAVIRPYPIRVGNTYDEHGNMIGTSGSYLDSPEITWEDVARRAGAPHDAFQEYTTVTGKLRRVFEPNFSRLREMCITNGVTQIALNFANYIDYSVYGVNDSRDLTPRVLRFIEKIEEETNVPVTLIGTGPKHSHIVDLRDFY